MRGAIFIHGWASSSIVWNRYWYLDRGRPMIEMFEKVGFETIILDLPGSFVHRDKDFKWYADHLGHIIREREDLEEIVLVGHSMGGIVARLYLQDRTELFAEGRSRVTSLIMLGTPNHGTSVPLFDAFSTVVTTIADMINPTVDRLVEGEEHNFFMTTPCYRDIQIGSDFLAQLNSNGLEMKIPVHVIWTNGDTVSEPQHTCIVEGASNHLIDRLSVNHFNMSYRKEVVDEVERILTGNDVPLGLQKYPEMKNCKGGGVHEWVPSTGIVTRDPMNVWECNVCGKIEKSHAIPLHIQIAGPDGRPHFHRWVRKGRFYRYRFRCINCNQEIWYPDETSYIDGTIQGEPFID